MKKTNLLFYLKVIAIVELGTIIAYNKGSNLFLGFQNLCRQEFHGKNQRGRNREEKTPPVKDLLLLERVRSKMINHGKS